MCMISQGSAWIRDMATALWTKGLPPFFSWFQSWPSFLSAVTTVLTYVNHGIIRCVVMTRSNFKPLHKSNSEISVQVRII